MVLVSYIPYTHSSILQTKLSNREGHEASCVGLETMPLDQDIEGSHREGEPGVEIRPDAMHDLLEVAHDGQHREHGLHEHTVLPRAPRTQFEIARIALGSMEGRITQDNHLVFKLSHQPLSW